MYHKKYVLLFIIIAATFLLGCERQNSNIDNLTGYIVGFAPCTIDNQYRIGYIIISENEMDTLEVYNMSDDVYKMPASILVNQDTLYTIPYTYFQNYYSSPYFPEEARYQFKIQINYRYAKENEKSIYWCTADIMFTNFPQIIVINASKPNI